jgi:rhodanese-related sulfurtransferase
MAPVALYLLLAWLAAAASLSGGMLALAGHDFEEPVDFVPAEQVKRLLDIGEDVVFIDMRTADEFAKGHLPSARSIPIDVLGHRWQEIPTAGRVVLYCTCAPGQRDETYAFTLMRQEKYRNITVLETGYADWVKRGYPIETASP